jgi:Uma2 family endonuclease
VKVIMPFPLPDVVAFRKRTGADRWDEMWEGVLHMSPAPTRAHQDLEGALEAYLRFHWCPLSGGEVYHQINVCRSGGWPNDYRIPDLVLLLPDRFHIDKDEYFEGPPNVVVEIHSAGDEAFEKIPFYLDLGVEEVWIIDRDTKAVQIFARRQGNQVEVPPAAEGYLASSLGIEIRGENGKLGIRLTGQPQTYRSLP